MNVLHVLRPLALSTLAAGCAAPALAQSTAPGPDPMAVAVTAPATVSYETESMFGFDESRLRPEGAKALDDFVQQRQGAACGSILVQGHTDRLGSEAYNQRLSLDRAQAVKSYLVDNGSPEAGRVSATGLGASQPVTGTR